jgi:ketose-bisphosphate aldolase
MAISNLLGDLVQAHHSGYALAGVNVYNLEGAQAVADAAERESAAVVLQAGSSAFRHAGEQPLAALALAIADGAAACVGVHLDHSRDLDEIRRCLDRGYTSVLIDGSHLSFRDNIDLTLRAVETVRTYGCWVEAELGALAGNEDRSTDATGSDMTDPKDAGRFVTATGVDALAVSVGNVHGISTKPACLDFDRLAAIRLEVAVPLVLHGASGLPDDQVHEAIRLGVTKININTEIRRTYLAALRTSLIASDSDEIGQHLGAARVAATEAIRSKIRSYRFPNKPSGGGQPR